MTGVQTCALPIYYLNQVDVLIKQNTFASNETGLVVDYVNIHNQNQNVLVTINDFLENSTGIYLDSIYVHPEQTGPEQFMITLNQFNGNEQYAVYYNPGAEMLPEAPAWYNWWADENGPVVKIPNEISMMNEIPAGDPVSENVTFDPWLKNLVITPTQNSMLLGETQTLTLRILDNDGIPVSANGLTVRLNISGAHTASQTLSFSGISTSMNYPGTPAATQPGQTTMTIVEPINTTPIGTNHEIPITGETGYPFHTTVMGFILIMTSAILLFVWKKKNTSN